MDFNREKRRYVTNGFEKNFLKLIDNSVYGKTVENLRKRINAILVNNEKDFLKYNTPANQLKLLLKSLRKIILLFMKLIKF